jgi:ATP-dependent Clp protease protease subunit
MGKDQGKEFINYAVKEHGMNSMHVENYLKSVHTPENLTRTIIEERQVRFAEIDVFSRLIMDRIIFLGTEINDYIASILQAQLLFLDLHHRYFLQSPNGKPAKTFHYKNL